MKYFCYELRKHIILKLEKNYLLRPSRQVPTDQEFQKVPSYSRYFLEKKVLRRYLKCTYRGLERT